MRTIRIVLALAALFLMAAPAWATPISFGLQGINTDNSAAIWMDYDPNTSVLSIQVTNPSTNPAGTSIAAFAFNLPSGVNVAQTTLPSLWIAQVSPDNIHTEDAVGYFDVLATTSTNQQFGGGVPQNGIALGQTYSFAFVMTGNNLATLTTQDFVDQLSIPQNSSREGTYFAARSHTEGDTLVPGDGGPETVPEPASYVLIGAGLLGIGWLALRRRVV